MATIWIRQIVKELGMVQMWTMYLCNLTVNVDWPLSVIHLKNCTSIPRGCTSFSFETLFTATHCLMSRIPFLIHMKTFTTTISASNKTKHLVYKVHWEYFYYNQHEHLIIYMQIYTFVYFAYVFARSCSTIVLPLMGIHVLSKLLMCFQVSNVVQSAEWLNKTWRRRAQPHISGRPQSDRETPLLLAVSILTFVFSSYKTYFISYKHLENSL